MGCGARARMLWAAGRSAREGLRMCRSSVWRPPPLPRLQLAASQPIDARPPAPAPAPAHPARRLQGQMLAGWLEFQRKNTWACVTWLTYSGYWMG